MTGEPRTGRGRASRERIVERAAELFAERGVGGASLDEVLAAAGAGKGQLCHYFRGRDELVEAAVGLRCTQVLAGLTQALGAVASLAELEQALAGFAAGFERACRGAICSNPTGCLPAPAPVLPGTPAAPSAWVSPASTCVQRGQPYRRLHQLVAATEIVVQLALARSRRRQHLIRARPPTPRSATARCRSTFRSRLARPRPVLGSPVMRLCSPVSVPDGPVA